MQRVRRLSRVDREYLEFAPQYLAVSLLRFAARPDGTVPTAEEIVSRVRSVLDRRDAPPIVASMRQRVRPTPTGIAPPFLEDDPSFDTSRHFYRHGNRQPVSSENPGWLLTDALSRPLDPDRPLWRVEIVDTFDDGSIGLLSTIHHAIADGVAAFSAIVIAALELTPEGKQLDPVVDPWTPRQPATAARTLPLALVDRVGSLVEVGRRAGRALGRIDQRSVSAAAARFAGYLQDEPPRNERPPRVQTFADRRGWGMHLYRRSLLELRLASRALGVTITDLFLAAAALAWGRIRPDAAEVWVLVPVDLREPGEITSTNLVGYVLVSVPCRLDPLATVRAAHARSAKAKEQDQARALDELARVRSFLPAAWQGIRWGRLDRADLALSNMPGFPFTLYCERAPLHDAFGASSLYDTSWGKITFVTFGEVVYGTLLHDSGPREGGTFDDAFSDGVTRLCTIASHRRLLARQPQLVALGMGDLDDLTRSVELVAFEAGEEIVTEGAPADAYYVIETGSAVVIVEAGRSLGTLGPGDSFGEMGVFHGGVRRATVTATRRTQVLRIDATNAVAAFHGDVVSSRPVERIIDGYEDVLRHIEGSVTASE